MEAKQLSRSKNDRMIGGVCGGIAEYFDWDSAIVRLIFIFIILMAGSGIFAYLVLWVLLPEGNEIKALPKPVSAAKNRQPILGIILLGLGVSILLQNFGLTQFIHLETVWPFALIGLGFFVLVK